MMRERRAMTLPRWQENLKKFLQIEARGAFFPIIYWCRVQLVAPGGVITELSFRRTQMAKKKAAKKKVAKKAAKKKTTKKKASGA